MTTIIFITKTIEFIPSDELKDKNNWLLLFREKYQYTCNKLHGYILDIISIEEIVNSTISIYNGNVILTCKLKVKNLLPVLDMTIEGTIQKIYNQGIFVLIKGCMKTFIPKDQLKSKNKIGDDITIQITEIRFFKGKYDCIGKIFL